MSHTDIVNQALAAVLAVFADQTVSKQQVRESLVKIQNEIDNDLLTLELDDVFTDRDC